jgi:uncharacterized protein (TIGR03437 family)
MRWAVYLPAVLAASAALGAEGSRQAPTYSAASIVNAASNAVGELAPYTFATIYGVNLAYSTHAMSVEDVRGGKLPTELASVRVLIDAVPAILYYVSPGQINLLIPNMLRRPETELQVTLEGKAGPTVKIALLEAAPALFQWEGNTVVATHPDWTPITAATPARPGDWVILFGTGLGETVPETVWGQVPQMAAPLKRLSEFQVLLAGTAVEAGRIAYAGVAPGFAGLYQINLRLPESLGNDPEIRIALGNQISPAGLRLPVRGPESPAASAQPAAPDAR